MNDRLPGEFAARLAEARACDQVLELEAKVAALEARLSANT